MQSFSIQFQNASYWLLPAVFAAVVIVYTSYFGRHHRTGSVWIVLLTLRCLLILGIFILLIQPIISWQTVRERKPVILIFADNSQSITAQKNVSADSVRVLITEIKKQIESRGGQVRLFPFGLDVEKEVGGSAELNFNNAGTDISAIYDYNDGDENRPIRAAILISDGVSTAGEDPLLVRNLSSYPVHTVGIGDSLMIMDPAVMDMTLPATATAGDSLLLEARVLPLGFGEPITVWMKKGDQISQKKTISSSPQSLIETVSFLLIPKDAGIHEYSVMIDTAEDRNPANNLRKGLLRVSQKSKRLVIIQNHPNFDSRYFSHALRSLKDLEPLMLFPHEERWHSPGVDQPFQMKWDALALFGFPADGVSQSQFQMVSDKIRRDKPALYVQYVPGLDIEKLNLMMDKPVQNFAFVRQRNGEVPAIISESQRRHPVLMNLLAVSGYKNDWANLPPVGMPFREIRLDDCYRPLIVTDDSRGLPIVSLCESEGKRRILITGTDLWRWKMMTVGAENHYIYSGLTQALISWLTDTLSTSSLQFSLSKDIFLKGELAEVSGIVTDVNGGIIPDAVLEAELLDERNNSANFLIQWDGTKYRGNVQLENEGNHRIRIHASQGDQVLGELQMALEVLPNSVEHQIIRQNVETLKGIANKTGGRYFTVENYMGIADYISYEKERVTISQKVRLWRWPGIFIILLLVATSEWIVRRISGYQ
ncbi:MAG: hypothetical protein ACP5FZ_07580 [Fidelibacterota bacterium]